MSQNTRGGKQRNLFVLPGVKCLCKGSLDLVATYKSTHIFEFTPKKKI